MNRFSKGRKPLPGSLSIVGKDSHGRKLVMPTYIDKESMSKTYSTVRRLFDKLLSRKRMNERYVKLTASLANKITEDYMYEVVWGFKQQIK